MKRTLQRPHGLRSGISQPVVTPIMPSVVYASESPDALDSQYEGQAEGYVYAREGHPNADVLAAQIGALEAMPAGIVTGSGMAAVTAVLMGVCGQGDHVLGGNQLYGRSLRLMNEDLPRMGIATSLADASDAASFAAALRPETRLVLIEVVSNPTLRIADVEGIAAMCRERGILLAVDNTFTTPAMLKPVDLGADIVLHSVTKMLAGHADVTLGWVSATDEALMDRIRTFAVTTGMTPSPFDCWLAERGLYTFQMRFERSQSTAERLASHLANAPGVKRVIYPQRADHPDAARAQGLLQGQGGPMVSFEIEGGRAAANAFAEGAAQVAFAPTLGDVGTTLSHPASSSHRALSDAQRGALGMSEGFFRVSVGLEEPDDLLAAFDAGLAAVEAL